MAHVHDLPGFGRLGATGHDPERFPDKSQGASSSDSAERKVSQGLSLEDAIEECGFGPFHWLTFGFVALSGYPPTKEMVTMSFLGPALVCSWKITPTQEATMQLAVFAGALLSSPIMGFLSDVIGTVACQSLVVALHEMPCFAISLCLPIAQDGLT